MFDRLEQKRVRRANNHNGDADCFHKRDGPLSDGKKSLGARAASEDKQFNGQG
jgi:hypothetical protein